MALTWTLKINDAISGPAKKAAGSVAGLTTAMGGLASATAKIDAQGRYRSSSGRFLPMGHPNRPDTQATKKAGWATQGPVSRSTAKELAANRQLAASMKSLQRGQLAVRDANMATMESFAMAGTAAAAAIALAAGAAIVSGVRSIGVAQKFKADTMFAFETILKTKGAAEAAYAKAAATSIEVGADFQESMRSMNTLLAMGFNVDFADQMVRAMSDLKTINPMANLEGITRAIGQIKATGRLQGDELMQLNEAGLSTAKVYEEIARSMGLVDKAGKTAAHQVQDLQAAGKISSDVAIAGIMAAIKGQTGGKEFGAISSDKADKSLAGLTARAVNLRDQMLGSVEIDWTTAIAGMSALIDAMKSPEAKEMMGAIGDAITDVMDAMFENITAGDIKSFFVGAAAAIRDFASTITGLIEIARVMYTVVDGAMAVWGAIQSVGEAGWYLQSVVEGLGSVLQMVILGPFVALIDTLATLGNQIREVSQTIGTGIIEGMVNGIKAGAQAVIDAVTGVAKSAIQSAKNALSEKSPSKKFFEIGADMMAGQAQGIGAAGSDVTKGVEQTSLQALSAGERIARSITTSNTSAVNVGDINVNGPQSGSPQGIGSAIADALRSLVVAHG